MLTFVSDIFKTQEMCNKAFKKSLLAMIRVLVQYTSQQKSQKVI